MGFGSSAFGGAPIGGNYGSPIVGASALTSWNLNYPLIRFNNCSPEANRPTYGVLQLKLVTTGGLHSILAYRNGNFVFSGSVQGNGTATIYDASGNKLGTVSLVYAGDFFNGQYIQSYPASYNVYYSLDPNWSYNVSAASWAANVATVTIGAHNITTGEQITITGVNPSGYNGTFTVTAITGTAVKYALTPNPGAYVSGGVVTRPKKATIQDDGRSRTFSWWSAPNLPAGTYYALVRQVSEDGIESTGTTFQTQLVVHVPAAPAIPTYLSGNYSNTVIQWPALTGGDSGSTYPIYDSLDTGIIPPQASITRGSGAGTINQQLNAISTTFTGIRYVLLKSLLAGIESSNNVVLQIQYTNGTVVLNRPNVPQVRSLSTSGRTITVNWTYDQANQQVSATQIQIFLATSPAAFNYGSPDGTTAVVAAGNRVLFGQITATAASDGAFYFALRSTSANGQSLNTNYYGPIELSNVPPSDPTVTLSGAV